MATYFVSSGGDNTTGATWATAYTSLAGAAAAATSGSDLIIIKYNGVPAVDADSMSADTVYTFTAGTHVISASADDASTAYTPTEMGETYYIGNNTSNRSITISGARVFLWGITLRTFTTTANDSITLNADGGYRRYENCLFRIGTGTASQISLNGTGNSFNAFSEYYNCVFYLQRTAHLLEVQGEARLHNCTIHASSAAVTSLFGGGMGTGNLIADGCDFSGQTGNIVSALSSSSQLSCTFINCKMASSFSWLATQTTTNPASGYVLALDCANGDAHYTFHFENCLGKASATDAVYADSGAKHDGTNGVSWNIVTTSIVTDRMYFMTPWIDLYHSGTSSITPYLECMRDNSAGAVYTDNEVWAEFKYKGTTSSAQATLNSDRVSFLGSGTAQDSSSRTWTGATGTPGKFKIGPTAGITPLEKGILRARICVAIASKSDIYVDPYIRTA